MALKTTWPQILGQEVDYANLVYEMLGVKELGENIWRCNIKQDDVKQLEISEPFWNDVLTSWSMFNSYKSKEIENQILWYNSNIKIAGKMVMWKEPFHKGLLYVHQLFENQGFLTDLEAQEKYGLSVMSFNSLKAAIPGEWRNFFMSTSKYLYMPLPPHMYDICIGTKAKGWSQKVYRWLSDDVILVHNKYISWRKELGQDFCETICDFGKEHMQIYKLTNITKYRSFQYRLLQRGLVTNIQLSKWGLKDNDKCSFCTQEPETLSHLFCTCEKVKDLWDRFKEYVNVKFDSNIIDLEPKNIILNTICSKRSHVINFLCLVVK